jgi:ABC-type branched-subunit amino acid transport system substrate-binding protein
MRLKRALLVVRVGVPVAALVAVSTLSIGHRFGTTVETRTVDAASAQSLTGPGGATGGPGVANTIAGSSKGGGVLASVPGLACVRGRNGGATDVGVTADAIKLGATVVKSGIGTSFLGQVPDALEAVKNQVNRAGGVCGRLLSLSMADDGWQAGRGQQFINNFIAEGMFALAVSPSSEGLDAAIRHGDISRAGIPVVGADGMLISQYREPWVWPVASSTITAMHVIAKNAADRGAKTFGLVYDKAYHFGVEGAAAFRGALERLFPGRHALKIEEAIDSSTPPFKSQVNDFNGACSPCDFVAMLLEPPAALQWIRDGASFGRVGTGGPQPLFVNSFAQSCGSPCNGMWVWSGYHPPIYPFDSLPAVTQYVNALRAQASVDVSNPFVEGGYLGMTLLVKGLQQVGPDLTRARLRAVLDSMTLTTGLTDPLRWRPGDHFANRSVHAFSIVVNSGAFSGWRYEQTGWISDPWVGLDS